MSHPIDRYHPEDDADLHNDPTTARQLRYLADRLTHVDERLEAGSQRMGLMEANLQANTATTIEVRDILAAAKGAFKFFGWLGLFMKWVGALATAVLALYTAIYMATHGGRPPGV